MRSDYAIQTLTTQLTIPQDTSVNVRMEHAFLVAVEYKIEAQVQAHPDALYTPLSDDAPFSSMAVDIPLSLTVNQSSNIPKIDVHTAPASHCDLHCHLTREVTGSGVKKRMQNMFRRKPSSKSASQSSYDQSSVAEKKSSRPGFLSFRSSSKANAREGSISSFVTGSSGALAPPSQFHQQQRHLPDDPSATVPPALTPSTLSQASQSQVFQSPNTYDNEDMPTPDSPPPKYTSKDSDSPQNPSWASSPGASVGANNVTYFEMFPDSESEPEEQDEPVEGLNVTDKHKGKERTVGHEVDQQEQPKEHEQLQQETEQQELLPAIPPPPPRAFVPPSPPSPQKEVPSQSTHRHVDDKPDLVSESESEDGSSDEDDLLAIMARREKRIERKRNSQRRADRE
ncbi:hypothetical protein BCR43DRAFT_170607 [Syncephalastrum racemosum]|uniref:Uncharacterized protein n=1 Tax=Syncephalastrum racemosum TaxID=13706 RepID=A0A1X2HPC0_SYNRA|nr:hypothetical protein BCR43DRAFT_170607 [Syncephalastrum racemosum]